MKEKMMLVSYNDSLTNSMLKIIKQIFENQQNFKILEFENLQQSFKSKYLIESMNVFEFHHS